MTFCNAPHNRRNTAASARRLWAARTAHGLLALALAASSGLTHAEKADRDKPMNIEADAMRYDDLKQTSVFTGNVVVTKGTIVLRGARIDVQQDPEGYQHGVVTAAPGKRAYFKQKRDGAPGSDEWVEGEGELIEYDGRAETVKFIRQAVMRRLVGTKVNDETRGAMITYDQVNDTYSVSGVADQVGTQPASNGRVRATIAPRADDKPAGPATKAPPAGTGLRPSTTLGGEKR